MRAHLLLSIALGFALARGAAAQESSGDMAGGLVPGGYLRASAGVAAPVNAQGNLRDWQRGNSYSVFWEDWQSGATGVGLLGIGLGATYNSLPINAAKFMSSYAPSVGGSVTSATASNAMVLEINSTLRVRIPVPFIMPAVNFGFGYIDWAPARIDYTTSTGATGSAQQQHRSGAELLIGGSVDRQLYDRVGIFGEAEYVFGYTTLGQSGYATPGGVCAASGCDALKNTTIGTIRGGVRVRITN